MRPYPRLSGFAALALLALGLAACDSAPGPATPSGEPPRLSDFTYSPADVVLAGLEVRDGLANVPFRIEVDAADPDGDLTGVFWVLQNPVLLDEVVASGTLADVGAGYRATPTIALPAAQKTQYVVLVWAEDDEGHVSNEFRGNVAFDGVGEPPSIDDVEADPPVVVPPTTFRLIATVSDPDGLANVLRVEGEAPNGSTFQLFDAGSGGDDVAGDGRYTAQFDVPSASPGVQTFTLWATDRAGLESERVTVDVEIQ